MSKEYCEYIIDQLSDWGNVTSKKMFGGYGLYYRGKIFALIIEEILYFKVDASNKTDYENADSTQFSYQAKGKTIQVSYWQVPIDVLDDREELANWAEKAYLVSLNNKR